VKHDYGVKHDEFVKHAVDIAREYGEDVTMRGFGDSYAEHQTKRRIDAVLWDKVLDPNKYDPSDRRAVQKAFTKAVDDLIKEWKVMRKRIKDEKAKQNQS
jgi:hypothetical protein